MAVAPVQRTRRGGENDPSKHAVPPCPIVKPPRSYRAQKRSCWAGCNNRHLPKAVVPARSTSSRPSHQPNAGQDHSDGEARCPEVKEPPEGRQKGDAEKAARDPNRCPWGADPGPPLEAGR